MPINAEFLKKALSGDGEVDVKVTAILTEYQVDVDGLKSNRDTILLEKNTLEAKFKALETEKSGYDTKIKELEDKIKKAGNEDTKAYFEAELKKLTETHEAKLKTLQTERDTASNEAAQYIANDEFARATKDLNIRPELKDDLRDVLYARNKFERKVIDGEKKYLNEGSRGVRDVLSAYLQTDAGKAYLQNGSSGSGASGSGIKSGAGITPPKEPTTSKEALAQALTTPEK